MKILGGPSPPLPPRLRCREILHHKTAGVFRSFDGISGQWRPLAFGPPLFTAFINDIDEVIKCIELIKKFADDTKLGQTASPEGQARMQEALDRLWEWGMQFNEKKCKVMYVGHNNTKQAYYMNR
jgi:hypothetical protein